MTGYFLPTKKLKMTSAGVSTDGFLRALRGTKEDRRWALEKLWANPTEDVLSVLAPVMQTAKDNAIGEISASITVEALKSVTQKGQWQVAKALSDGLARVTGRYTMATALATFRLSSNHRMRLLPKAVAAFRAYGGDDLEASELAFFAAESLVNAVAFMEPYRYARAVVAVAGTDIAFDGADLFSRKVVQGLQHGFQTPPTNSESAFTQFAQDVATRRASLRERSLAKTPATGLAANGRRRGLRL